MSFVDEVRIHVRSGKGGAGCVSFRREKFVPLGGPDGGNGGNGGHVFIEADENMSTLLDYRFKRKHHAENGRPGEGSQCAGRDGSDLVIRVPVGTMIYLEPSLITVGDEDEDEENKGSSDEERLANDTKNDTKSDTKSDTEHEPQNDTLLCDLSEHAQSFVVAKGGRGGKGNEHFKTSVRQAPRHAQPGEPWQEFDIRLELKLLADVGLVGLPNVGKSSLIARASAAKPKIANYPFTTLVPNLGVVQGEEERHFVMADVPGLIVGASEGRGLGSQFLRHVERVSVIAHVITYFFEEEGRDPVLDFEAIEAELASHNTDLVKVPRVIVLNRLDLPDVAEQNDRLKLYAKERGIPYFAISAVTGEGVRRLCQALSEIVYNAKVAKP